MDEIIDDSSEHRGSESSPSPALPHPHGNPAPTASLDPGVVADEVEEIDQLRRSQQELRGARDFAQSVISSVPLPLAVVDRDLRIRSANDAFRALAHSGAEDLEKRSIIDLAAAAIWGLGEPLRKNLQDLKNSEDSGTSFVFEHRVTGEQSRVFSVRGRLLKPDVEMFLLVTLEDVTVHKEVERLLTVEREWLATEVASTARELGRTQDELRALAGSLITSQEEERRRVARELHDDICQKLAVLEIDSQQIEAHLGPNAGRVAQDLEKVRTAIGSLSEEVRRISHALHPSVIDDLGIAPALRSLIDDFREREHMIVTFTAQDVPEHIPAHVTTALYRIAQEALRNVAKHAGKTHVKITLKGGSSAIRLQIMDYGEGFDVQARRSGLGLISMEERARMLEGTFHVESNIGEGTRMIIEVPWPTASRRN